jgi:hypothetical protein
MKTLIMACLLFVPVLSAQSLEEREAWENQEKHMKDALEPVKKFCGIDLQVTLDRPSWNKVRQEWNDASPSGRCSDVTDRLVDLCRKSETAKDAVVQGLKKFHCSFGGKTSGFKFQLEAGALIYAVETERANINDEIMALLRKLL